MLRKTENEQWVRLDGSPASENDLRWAHFLDCAGYDITDYTGGEYSMDEFVPSLLEIEYWWN